MCVCYVCIKGYNINHPECYWRLNLSSLIWTIATFIVYITDKWHTKNVFCWCSVTKLCPTLWDPMDCSTPGFPALRYLMEFAQTHVHWVSDAIQPSRPLLAPSACVVGLSQYQGLFQRKTFPMSRLFTSGGQSIGASASASVPPLSIQVWFL